MPNTVAITKVMDGPRNVVVHVFLESDGSGELSKQIILDPTQDLNPATNAVPTFTVEKIKYSLHGFAAKVEFDYLLTETPLWVLTEENEASVCFEKAGGLKDRSNVLDGTGKLLLTTIGFTAVGDMGSVVFYLRKD